MSSSPTIAVVGAAITIGAAAVAAQGLGAVAARAAEERRTSDRPAVSITNVNLPEASVLDAALTTHELSMVRYSSARACIAEARMLFPAADASLLREEESGRGALAIEGAMADRPEIASCFKQWQISPREYTLEHLAYQRALDDRPRSALTNRELPLIRGNNARRLQDTEERFGKLSDKWAMQEQKLIAERGRRR